MKGWEAVMTVGRRFLHSQDKLDCVWEDLTESLANGRSAFFIFYTEMNSIKPVFQSVQFLRTVVELAIPDLGPRLAVGVEDHSRVRRWPLRLPLGFHGTKEAIKMTGLPPSDPSTIQDGLTGVGLGWWDLWFSSQRLRLNSQDNWTICQ